MDNSQKVLKGVLVACLMFSFPTPFVYSQEFNCQETDCPKQTPKNRLPKPNCTEIDCSKPNCPETDCPKTKCAERDCPNTSKKDATQNFSDCIKSPSLSFVGFIVCAGAALVPGKLDYFRMAGGITDGIYTFSENTTTGADAGVSIVGGLGFISDDTRKLRAEFEIGYSSNPLNKKAETNSDGTIMAKDTVGTLRQISTMLAVIYEIIPDCRITPYLKAGVGPIFLTMSDVKVENRLVFKQQTKTFFAYQFGGGLKYTIIEDKLAIDVGYRHIDTMTDVTLQTGSNRATVGIGNHTGLIGLTYLF